MKLRLFGPTWRPLPDVFTHPTSSLYLLICQCLLQSPLVAMGIFLFCISSQCFYWSVNVTSLVLEVFLLLYVRLFHVC